MFKREIYNKLLSRLKEVRRFIQVLTGPRQVGKTTLVEQVMEAISIPILYASADEPTLQHTIWIEQQWDLARLEMKTKNSNEGVLVLDEVQKIPGWSEIVKRLWDEDTRNKLSLKIVLLGSAPLLMEQGLAESLAGRFEQIPATHWSYTEMQKAFNCTLEQYIYFGGYPGAAALIQDQQRWQRYVYDSLIETTLSRDILLLTRIHKPALLRHLFELACHYSGQILSYQKMLGQLQDAGNTTTLAHYLDLLGSAGMVGGLKKFAGQVVRQRESSPKLQVFNTALLSAQSPLSFEEAQKDRAYWGRLVESAVGAYLVNSVIDKNIEVFYWRDGGKEVDFILRHGNKLIAIEVKTGKDHSSGMPVFCEKFQPIQSLVVGSQNLSLEKFLSIPITHWFEVV